MTLQTQNPLMGAIAPNLAVLTSGMSGQPNAQFSSLVMYPLGHQLRAFARATDEHAFDIETSMILVPTLAAQINVYLPPSPIGADLRRYHAETTMPLFRLGVKKYIERALYERIENAPASERVARFINEEMVRTDLNAVAVMGLLSPLPAIRLLDQLNSDSEEIRGGIFTLIRSERPFVAVDSSANRLTSAALMGAAALAGDAAVAGCAGALALAIISAGALVKRCGQRKRDIAQLDRIQGVMRLNIDKLSQRQEDFADVVQYLKTPETRAAFLSRDSLSESPLRAVRDMRDLNISGIMADDKGIPYVIASGSAQGVGSWEDVRILSAGETGGLRPVMHSPSEAVISGGYIFINPLDKRYATVMSDFGGDVAKRVFSALASDEQSDMQLMFSEATKRQEGYPCVQELLKIGKRS